VNIGDAKSLAAHPAYTTHRQLSPAELEKSGVTPNTARLCIGIEHIEDLLGDSGQALAGGREANASAVTRWRAVNSRD